MDEPTDKYTPAISGQKQILRKFCDTNDDIFFIMIPFGGMTYILAEIAVKAMLEQHKNVVYFTNSWTESHRSYHEIKSRYENKMVSMRDDYSLEMSDGKNQIRFLTAAKNSSVRGISPDIIIFDNVYMTPEFLCEVILPIMEVKPRARLIFGASTMQEDWCDVLKDFLFIDDRRQVMGRRGGIHAYVVSNQVHFFDMDDFEAYVKHLLTNKKS